MTMLGDYDLEKLLDAIRWQESRGNQRAVSPKGARTAYGIMPTTAEDPGYMKGYPKDPNRMGMLMSDEGAARNFARDYLTAMYDRTQDVPSALASYNGGLGRGIAFKNGKPVPAETAGYVPSVMGLYKNGVPGRPAQPPVDPNTTDVAETMTPRMRFDQLTKPSMQGDPGLLDMINPISTAQAAEGPLGPGVGTVPPNMTPVPGRTPLPSSVPQRTPLPPANMSPIPSSTFERPEDTLRNSMMGGFSVNDITPSQGVPVAEPERLSPPAPATTPSADDAAFAKQFDQRYGGKEGPYSWLAGPGMQIGAALMTQAGMPVSGAAALNSLSDQKALRLKQQQLDLERQNAKAIYEAYRAGGASAKDAFLYATNPELAPKWDTKVIGQKNGLPVYAQEDQFGNQRPSPMGDNGPDPSADLTGKDYLEYLRKTDPGYAKVIEEGANYNADPNELFSKIRGRKEKAIEDIMRVNPNFQLQNYANIKQARKAYAADGKYGNALRSADQAIHHLGLLKDKFTELNKRAGGPADSGHFYSSAYNTGRGFLLGQEADEALAGSKGPAQGVADEIAKLFHGVGAVPEAEIDAWKKTIHTNMSPQEQKEAIRTLLQLMSGGMQSYKNNYELAVGPAYAADHPFEEVFKFSPHSHTILKDLGVEFGMDGPKDVGTSPAPDGDMPPPGLPEEDQKLWSHYNDEERAALIKRYGG